MTNGATGDGRRGAIGSVDTDVERRPADPGDACALPHALTFFLSVAERRTVLSKLKHHGAASAAERGPALLRALGIDTSDRNGQRSSRGGD